MFSTEIIFYNFCPNSSSFRIFFGIMCYIASDARIEIRKINLLNGIGKFGISVEIAIILVLMKYISTWPNYGGMRKTRRLQRPSLAGSAILNADTGMVLSVFQSTFL